MEGASRAWQLLDLGRVHVSTFGVYDMRRDVPKVLGEDFHRGQGRAYGNSKACKELGAKRTRHLLAHIQNTNVV